MQDGDAQEIVLDACDQNEHALPKEITQTHSTSSFATFKNTLKEQYHGALILTFDLKDLWKTNYVKCNCVRSLQHVGLTFLLFLTLAIRLE